MATVITEQPTSDRPTAKGPTTSEPVLASHLDMRYALRPRHALLVAVGCALFLTLNYLPLQVTDLWGHVAYGQWIWQHGSLPTADPVSALADGMRVVDMAWLSQVILSAVEPLGVQALSNLFAVTLLIASVLLARTFYLQTGSTAWAGIGSLVVWVIGWSGLAAIGPENFGWVCFATLLLLIVSSQSREQAAAIRHGLAQDGGRWRLWIGVPLVMAMWANLDGSFVCGLAVLACYFVGHVVETLWRTRRVSAVLADRDTHVWLALCELSLLATLCNPYGYELLFQVFAWPISANLRELAAWQPLNLAGVGGCAFALSWMVLVVVMRHSRRPVSVAHALMLGLFAVATATATRTLGWYAIVFSFVLVPHLSEIGTRFSMQRKKRHRGANRPVVAVGWMPTLLALLAIWTTFALSGLSQSVLGGVARSDKQMLSDDTPLGVTEYLQAHPPQGQTFHPRWWGDWLAMRGPTGFQAFVTSNVHLAPSHVWVDYGRIARAEPGWQRALDRYRVNTVIVDPAQQPLLASVLREADEWSLRYDDDQALVFVRGDSEQADARSRETLSVESQTVESRIEITDVPVKRSSS